MARDRENCCASGQLMGARKRRGEREATGRVEREEGRRSWVGRIELAYEERRDKTQKKGERGEITDSQNPLQKRTERNKKGPPLASCIQDTSCPSFVLPA